MDINPGNLDFLAGLNCQMIVSKDNDLRWLREQLTFHASRCGLEAVCFIDNGSTAYDLQELGETLCSAGLKKAVLMSMPYKWGGLNRRPMHRELYLQTSAYNVARLAFLGRARAVACLDADEVLFPSRDEISIFDRAVQARLGFVRFFGANRFPDPACRSDVQFRDHQWVLPGQDMAAHKWCLNPQGPLGAFQWRCHNLEHNILEKFQTLEDPYFYHCLGIGTGWKDPNRGRPELDLSHDAPTGQFWTHDFEQAVSAV